MDFTNASSKILYTIHSNKTEAHFLATERMIDNLEEYKFLNKARVHEIETRTRRLREVNAMAMQEKGFDSSLLKVILPAFHI